MAVVASKLFAISIKDVSEHKDSVVEYRDDRISTLEAQLRDILEWRGSLTDPSTISTSSSSSSSQSSWKEEIADDQQSISSISSIPSTPPRSTSTTPTSAVTKEISEHKPSDDTAARILTIIERYGQNEANASGTAWLGRVRFEPIVREQVQNNEQIHMVLPAFPWKSVNKVEKVLGPLPDLGEELGIARLNALCNDINEIYEHGAEILITSDGLVYNDLLGISDAETYTYGAALRQMAADKGFSNIRFIRIMNLLGLSDSIDMSKEEYLRTVGSCRELLVSRYLPADFDVRDAITNDTDINLTYCGYMHFLAKDLRHSPITAGITGKNEYRRAVKRVATSMITRGKAFARAIELVLPTHVRLSIHRSTGLLKLSVPLVPQNDHFSMTPWHCCIAVSGSTGTFRTAHAKELEESGKYELVMRRRGGRSEKREEEGEVEDEDERPYFYRDRHEMWEWEGVSFEHVYPKGVIVRAEKEGLVFGREEMKKVDRLAKVWSPVITVGFASG